MIALYSYLAIVFTWVLYLAIMNLAANRSQFAFKDRPVVWFHAYLIVLPVGYVMDAALNLFFCLLFWRKPKDWLLTGTLKRMIATEDNWRETVASWICTNLLNPFDSKGRHC